MHSFILSVCVAKMAHLSDWIASNRQSDLSSTDDLGRRSPFVQSTRHATRVITFGLNSSQICALEASASAFSSKPAALAGTVVARCPYIVLLLERTNN